MTNKKAKRSRASKATTTSSDFSAMGSVVSSTSAAAAAAIESFPPPTTNTVASVTNIDKPAQASIFIVHDNSESGLLKLPNEVKQRIWSLAVTVEAPIEPQQIREHSNKFIWSEDQINKKTHAIEVGAVPQLTAVQLAKVCRSIYDDVATTHLFYTVNEFHFGYSGYRNQPAALTYLVAITEPRRNAIRNIKVPWVYSSKVAGAQYFTLITACLGLQSLDLKLNRIWGVPLSGGPGLPGFKECLVAVQGLKKLTVSLEDHLSGAGWEREKEQTERLCKQLEPLLKERMAMSRSKTYNLTKFRQAQLVAKLDVHGEGRLSKDKKPGQVSSRTRQQVRNVDNMTADGTIPPRDSPKYDLNGDLAWVITAIEQSREAVLEGIQSVEFLVKGGPSYSGNTWERFCVQEGKGEKFWEDVTVLNSPNCRHRINDFYEKNLKAYGAQLVLDVWRLREFEPGSEGKTKVQTEKRLEATIKALAVAEKKEAEEAARVAREAAKAEKADKQALKVKKPKPSKGHR